MRISEILYGAGTVTLFPGSRPYYAKPAARRARHADVPSVEELLRAAQAQRQLFREHLVGQLLVTGGCLTGIAATLYLSTTSVPEWAQPVPYVLAMLGLIACNLYRAKRDCT
jgi:hypothetical protein